jgi:hypothetical protein
MTSAPGVVVTVSTAPSFAPLVEALGLLRRGIAQPATGTSGRPYQDAGTDSRERVSGGCHVATAADPQAAIEGIERETPAAATERGPRSTQKRCSLQAAGAYWLTIAPKIAAVGGALWLTIAPESGSVIGRR